MNEEILTSAEVAANHAASRAVTAAAYQVPFASCCISQRWDGSAFVRNQWTGHIVTVGKVPLLHRGAILVAGPLGQVCRELIASSDSGEDITQAAVVQWNGGLRDQLSNTSRELLQSLECSEEQLVAEAVKPLQKYADVHTWLADELVDRISQGAGVSVSIDGEQVRSRIVAEGKQ